MSENVEIAERQIQAGNPENDDKERASLHRCMGIASVHGFLGAIYEQYSRNSDQIDRALLQIQSKDLTVKVEPEGTSGAVPHEAGIIPLSSSLDNISFIAQDEGQALIPPPTITSVYERHDSTSESDLEESNQTGICVINDREDTMKNGECNKDRDESCNESNGEQSCHPRKRRKLNHHESDIDKFIAAIKSLDQRYEEDADELFLKSLLPSIRPIADGRKLRLKAQIINLISSEESDSDELFLRSLLPELKSLTDHKKLQFKAKIMNALTELTSG